MVVVGSVDNDEVPLRRGIVEFSICDVSVARYNTKRAAIKVRSIRSWVASVECWSRCDTII